MEKKIKILHIVRSLHMGGLEQIVSLLSTQVNKDVYDVSVCCLVKKGYVADQLMKKGITVLLLESHNLIHQRYFLWWTLSKVLKKVKPDIVHTHNTAAMIDGIVAARIAGVPVVIHTDHARAFPDKIRYMIIERILSMFVDSIVSVSEFTKKEIIQFEKIAANKIVVIPNGVPVSSKVLDGGDIKEKLNLGLKFPILGYVGRLMEEKGVIYLIKAMSSIVKLYPQSHLLIIGDGELLKTYEQDVAMLNLSDNVSFCGYQENVDQYIQCMDIFVLPSLREGMPLCIIEAMSHGKVVIASDVGGIHEVIDNKVNGFLIPPKNITAIVDTIVSVLGQPDTCSNVGYNAKNRYNEAFTDTVMVCAYDKLYRDKLERYYAKN